MRLTQARVVTAALEVLDRVGLDGLTMRSISEHLGVQHNTVHWHVESKGRLLELLADAMFEGCADAPLPDAWDERARELVRRSRLSLLRRKDGARLVAGVSVPSPNVLGFSEEMIATLLGAGFGPELAARTHWLLFYFTLGITQEQQSVPGESVDLPDTITADAYPALYIAKKFLGAGDFDARFEFGVELLLEAAAARRTVTGETTKKPAPGKARKVAPAR